MLSGFRGTLLFFDLFVNVVALICLQTLNVCLQRWRRLVVLGHERRFLGHWLVADGSDVARINKLGFRQ